MMELPGYRMDGKPADMLRFLKRVVGRKTKSFFRLQQSEFFLKKKSRTVKVRKVEGKERRSGGGGERVRSGTEGGRGGGGRWWVW